MKTLPVLFLIMLAAAIVVTVGTPDTAAAPGVTVTTIYPQASGTIRYFPILNILDFAPIGNSPIQSHCFDTTGENLEWRRGFVEFGIPVFPDRIKTATITVVEPNNGWVAAPLPPDVHELFYYPADLVVDPGDFDQPTTLIGTFETDNNDPPGVPLTFIFDVTRAVREAQGSALGFRIKLQIDPASPCAEFDFAGTELAPITLQITTKVKGSPG